MAKKKPIVVLVAHSDDQALGCGGTIAKFAREGHPVYTIICSFGEQSHPHLRPEVIRKIRVQEAQKADKILGGSGVSFVGLKEGKFLNGIEKDDQLLFKNLVKRFKELKPEKVFTHSIADSHPDHRAVHAIANRLRKKVSFELYTFHIWTIFNKLQGKTPILFVDISEVFGKKIKAIHVFESQINVFSFAQFNNILYLFVYLKAFISGLRKGTRYAETFHYEVINNNR